MAANSFAASRRLPSHRRDYAELPNAFQDGIFFIPLAPLRDPALVVPTIATTLGARESGGTTLVEALQYTQRDKERLLVIDNFKHVVEATEVVGELLAAAPRLKVLVTSRASLHVYGEHEYPVPPMEVPHPQSHSSLERLAQVEAVALFAQGAQRVQPGFALSEENAPAVVDVCSRLDGLPLAVELAAARAKLFSPQAMLAQQELLAAVLYSKKLLTYRMQPSTWSSSRPWSKMGPVKPALFRRPM